MTFSVICHKLKYSNGKAGQWWGEGCTSHAPPRLKSADYKHINPLSAFPAPHFPVHGVTIMLVN